MENRTELKIELEKIINKYIPKIGDLEDKNYNEQLDNICSDLLDFKAKI